MSTSLNLLSLENLRSRGHRRFISQAKVPRATAFTGNFSFQLLTCFSSYFPRVIDKLRRGFVRRSSSQPSGQADFLDSISKMSDSRIVENWLLSLDEEAAAPVEVVEVPDKLLRVSESSSNSHRGGVTPTNELFEQDRKANGSEPERVLFQLAASSEDDESLGGEDQMRCQRPSSAPPSRQAGLMRQMSECSEYTTDTHDTGETAQVRQLGFIDTETR